MKKFTGFGFEDGKYKLEIYCSRLEPVEVDKLVKTLVGQNFRLTYVGGDTIRAQLELVKYPEIIKVMKQLEKEGFFWSEETPKANS